MSGRKAVHKQGEKTHLLKSIHSLPHPQSKKTETVLIDLSAACDIVNCNSIRQSI